MAASLSLTGSSSHFLLRQFSASATSRDSSSVSLLIKHTVYSPLPQPTHRSYIVLSDPTRSTIDSRQFKKTMYTHTSVSRPFVRDYPSRISRYQKGKTNQDFTEARDSEWQWHQLGYMQVCTSLQTDNHASTQPLTFFTGRMPFLPPNQQHQSTEGKRLCTDTIIVFYCTTNLTLYVRAYCTRKCYAKLANEDSQSSGVNVPFQQFK